MQVISQSEKNGLCFVPNLVSKSEKHKYVSADIENWVLEDMSSCGDDHGAGIDVIDEVMMHWNSCELIDNMQSDVFMIVEQ